MILAFYYVMHVGTIIMTIIMTMMMIYLLFVILIVMAVKVDCLIAIYRIVLRLKSTTVFMLSMLNAVRKYCLANTLE